jgi:hypothetical protein
MSTAERRFAEDQTQCMFLIYRWFLTQEENFELEVITLLDMFIEQIVDTLRKSNCDMDTDITFQVGDVLRRWNLNHHYPFLQPDRRRDREPKTHLELVDFLKSLEMYIHFPCSYYANTAENRVLVDYDLKFLTMREPVFKVIAAFKEESGWEPGEDALMREIYTPSGASRNRTQSMGIEGVKVDLDLTAWIKTGMACRTVKAIEKKYTVFDKLAYLFFKGKTAQVKYLPQCSISGSTYAVLGTLLLCTRNVRLSKGEMARMMLVTMCILVLDGGHNIQECIAVMGIIATFYPLFEGMHPSYPPVQSNVERIATIMKPIQFFPVEPIARSWTLADMKREFAVVVRSYGKKYGETGYMSNYQALPIYLKVIQSSMADKTIFFHESAKVVSHLLSCAEKP